MENFPGDLKSVSHRFIYLNEVINKELAGAPKSLNSISDEMVKLREELLNARHCLKLCVEEIGLILDSNEKKKVKLKRISDVLDILERKI